VFWYLLQSCNIMWWGYPFIFYVIVTGTKTHDIYIITTAQVALSNQRDLYPSTWWHKATEKSGCWCEGCTWDTIELREVLEKENKCLAWAKSHMVTQAVASTTVLHVTWWQNSWTYSRHIVLYVMCRVEMRVFSWFPYQILESDEQDVQSGLQEWLRHIDTDCG
jgi:hypothetical protein